MAQNKVVKNEELEQIAIKAIGIATSLGRKREGDTLKTSDRPFDYVHTYKNKNFTIEEKIVSSGFTTINITYKTNLVFRAHWDSLFIPELYVPTGQWEKELETLSQKANLKIPRE
jgi:hypothetical protein